MPVILDMINRKLIVTKQIVLDFMKRNAGRHFTKNFLTTEIRRDYGNQYSISYVNVDKWVEVLLACNEIKSEYISKIKTIWWEHE
jgi:hypothetical protein